MLTAAWPRWPPARARPSSAALAAAVGALAGMPVHVCSPPTTIWWSGCARLAPMYACLGLRAGFVIGPRRGGPPGGLRPADLLRHRPRAGLRLPARRSTAAGFGRRPGRGRRGCGTARPPGHRCSAACAWRWSTRADSLLIDEAMMPLILSRQVKGRRRAGFLAGLAAASGLAAEGISRSMGRRARSSSARLGEAWLAERAGRWAGAGVRPPARGKRLSGMALAARPRLPPGRALPGAGRQGRDHRRGHRPRRARAGGSRGLHGFVELKEGCRASPATETWPRSPSSASSPLPPPGRHERDAAGGPRRTARDLWIGCGLHSVTLPPSKNPAEPYIHSETLCGTPSPAGWRNSLVMGGRCWWGHLRWPSRRRCRRGSRRPGSPTAVLNARFDADEAGHRGPGPVSRAGDGGHQHGRAGTDIPSRPVPRGRGLHVMCCQFNASRRIDRQLEGRCAGRAIRAA